MNRWRVVVGGVSMNLALGSLYAWSVFVLPLEQEFGWTRSQTSWVYTIAVVVFASTFVAGGPHSGPARSAAVRAGRRHSGLARVLRGELHDVALVSLRRVRRSSSAPATDSAMRRRCRSRRSGFPIGAASSSG